MKTTPSVWIELLEYTRETALLVSTAALLEWDEHTGLPERATEYRAEQLALLSGMIHRRRTDPRVGRWLDELRGSDWVADPHGSEGATLRCLQREYDQQRRLPETLVTATARAVSLGQQAWVKSKRDRDFASFLPHLAEIVRLRREEASLLREGNQTLYDALLDQYEEGARSGELDGVFRDLREALVPLLRQVASVPSRPDGSSLRGDFPIAQQRALARWIAEQMGFDFQRGRLDDTEHPFCTTLGPHDHRILSRYHPNQFSSGLFGVLHEAGHGMYEQGLETEWFGTPAGSPASLGIHESQSRLWENQVGLSPSFWKWCFPTAVQHFPSLTKTSPEKLVADLNRVAPSLIRIEADEVTYNLHILIRYELEKALFEEGLDPGDLPQAWSDKYEEYLGIRPSHDGEGVLQDVHWSAGLIGYFPTYTLGNLYAAQLFEAADASIGPVHEQIARGEFQPLLGWLRENVHRYGRRYLPIDLIQRATGRTLSSAPLIAHLQRKLELIS